MVADESDMRGKAGETVPSRKRLCLDQQSGEAAVLSEIGIRKSGETTEILRGQRARRLHTENAPRFDDHVFQHMVSPDAGQAAAA